MDVLWLVKLKEVVMTHTFVARNAYRKLHVFSLVTALALLTTGALANTTNQIPYEEGFEDPGMGWTNGAVLAGTNGWYDADAGTGTVVVANTYTYPHDLPLVNAHSNYVALSGSVSNLFNETGDGHTNVWIDMMVMPSYSATAPEVIDDFQVALYFDTNGLINIRHNYRILDEFGDPVFNGADWSTLSNAPVPSNTWVRLTLTMDYLNSGFSDAYYQVRLDGGAPLAGFYGVSDPTWGEDFDGTNISRNGTWFVIANNSTGVKDFNSITMLGEGAFDDLQVKITNVLSGPVYTPKGIPEDWYIEHGLDPADEEEDSDLDGADNWEEYVAGTVPTNPASVFILLGVEYAGDSNKVSWYATTDGGAATNPFSMLISTNLQSWVTNELNNIPHDIDGTYDWWDTAPPAEGPVHYRPVMLWE